VPGAEVVAQLQLRLAQAARIATQGPERAFYLRAFMLELLAHFTMRRNQSLTW
jgi:hypothetical protein